MMSNTSCTPAPTAPITIVNVPGLTLKDTLESTTGLSDSGPHVKMASLASIRALCIEARAAVGGVEGRRENGQRRALGRLLENRDQQHHIPAQLDQIACNATQCKRGRVPVVGLQLGGNQQQKGSTTLVRCLSQLRPLIPVLASSQTAARATDCAGKVQNRTGA